MNFIKLQQQKVNYIITGSTNNIVEQQRCLATQRVQHNAINSHKCNSVIMHYFTSTCQSWLPAFLTYIPWKHL